MRSATIDESSCSVSVVTFAIGTPFSVSRTMRRTSPAMDAGGTAVRSANFRHVPRSSWIALR